jgi:hypothetical protein
MRGNGHHRRTDCYVLDDEQKTTVVSQRGMGEALGLGQGGSRVSRLINNPRVAPYIGPELRKKLENPLIFQGQPAGPNIPPQRIFGYDVTILIAILSRRSDWRNQQLPLT